MVGYTALNAVGSQKKLSMKEETKEDGKEDSYGHTFAELKKQIEEDGFLKEKKIILKIPPVPD